ncbi:putative pentatricopeptide repeat-containing protein At5g37570 [Typha angustifolia]|uniref:putative pentatricopeptide repeat-containing protein At5g37570 n=1 Tax=Typha angustifolia TaxID=59011 RepID=UPI003C2AEF55
MTHLLRRQSSPSVAGLLASCRSLRDLTQIHAVIIRKGLDQHHHLLARFVSLCDSFSSPSYAAAAFAVVSSPSLILFNAVLSALSRHSTLFSVVAHFNLLRRSSPLPPDAFSFPSLLSACSKASAFGTGASAHAVALCCGLDNDLFVRTALVDFYSKCGKISAARALFDSMEVRNEVTWTAIISGYLTFGDLASAKYLFDEMPTKNAVTWNVMIAGYVKFRDLISARRLFAEMPNRDEVSFTTLIDGFVKAGDMVSARSLFKELVERDLFIWSVMISGYVQNGRPGEALRMFFELYEQGIQPDEYIVVGLMSASSQLGSLEMAKWVDSYVAQSLIDVKNARILAGLIDMNAKCGNIERAAILFESMPDKDVISYCSMMQGYCLHGLGAKAVDLFSRMLQDGLSPDNVAFTVVLTACSHAGLVEEGKKYFDLMRNEYLIVPSADHYACMVDLLGRSGRLNEAYELVKLMPVEPHAGAWGALLGACRLYCDIDLGNVVANKLFQIEPQNAGNYVSLSNIYAVANRWAAVSELRTMMRESGVRKIPGCTRILP